MEDNTPSATMDMGAMVGDVIPELVLVIGGVIVLLYALAVPMLDGQETYTFAETYARDLVAIWAKLIVLVATAAVIALSLPWFRTDPRGGEYYTLLLFSALGAVLLAGATDLKQFIASMLLSSATGFVLVAYHRASRASAEAGIKYYLLGALTSASMLLGVAYLFGLAGSTTLSGLRTGLAASSGPGLAVAVALVVVAVAFKLGAVPAHAWMPDVAEGAPAPVAAFVTSLPKVGAFVFLARMVLVLPADGVGWRPLLAVIAAATMTLGNLAALWQDDVRRLLDWSSVSQTGYGLLAVVAVGRSDLAVPSLLYFLLAYVLANVAAFGVVVHRPARLRRPRPRPPHPGCNADGHPPVLHRRTTAGGVRRQAEPVRSRHRSRLQLARRRRCRQHRRVHRLLRPRDRPDVLRRPARTGAGLESHGRAGRRRHRHCRGARRNRRRAVLPSLRRHSVAAALILQRRRAAGGNVVHHPTIVGQVVLSHACHRFVSETNRRSALISGIHPRCNSVPRPPGLSCSFPAERPR